MFMKTKQRVSAIALAITAFVLLGAGSRPFLAAQKSQHIGIKVEGYAIIVTPDSIMLLDKKNHEIEIRTEKDYTSLVGIAVPVTVWYTTKDGVNHLEDIVYPQSGAFAPADQLGAGIKRIIILPRPQGVDDSDGLTKAISKYLADNAGWYVAPPELASEIAARSQTTSALDAIDSDTGKVDMQRYLAAQRSLTTTIAEETRSDAVLEVRVLKVKAHVRGGVASWDDMTEPVASRATRMLSPFGQLEASGWVYAATADMSFWSKTGNLLWKKRRGFAVLAVQTDMGVKYRPRPLTDVYGNTDAMQRWLRDTLGQLAPPTQATPAGSPQLPPDVQKQLDKAKEGGEGQK